jgi:hypothetical protein
LLSVRTNRQDDKRDGDLGDYQNVLRAAAKQAVSDDRE